MAARMRGDDTVFMTFCGDGGTSSNDFHTGLNFAAVYKAPVVFVCENNLFAESTPWFYHCAAKDIAERGAAYNMPGLLVDGTDVFAVHEAVGEAIMRARRGDEADGLDLNAHDVLPHG